MVENAMTGELHEDEFGQVILRMPGLTWHTDTMAVTDDGYVARIDTMEDESYVVIFIQPPWHKPFYRSVFRSGRWDAAREIARLITLHRAEHDLPILANAPGNARKH